MVLCGNSACTWQAVPMPDSPAPMIRTSKCCAFMVIEHGRVAQTTVVEVLTVLIPTDFLSFPDSRS